MYGRKLIALAAVLAAVALAVVLTVLFSPFGSTSPSEPSATVNQRQSGAPPPGTSLPAVDRSDPAADDPPTATATPEPKVCKPMAGYEPLPGTQILSYYGNPYTADMGILGELPPEELVERLKAHAQLYDSLNGARRVQPALHLVYATAQSYPGDDDLYLLYVDEETLRQYIDLACDNGLLIFLDLHIGRSDVRSEVTKILPYLQQAHVHVALDPEFAMPAGGVPGDIIGSLDAAQINAAQSMLHNLIVEQGLPDKILIVHQFLDDMITRPKLIQDFARVRLVIDMDGFGPSHVKRTKFGWFAAPAEYSGIKLFFRQDTDLMSEQEVLELDPDVIIYQ